MKSSKRNVMNLPSSREERLSTKEIDIEREREVLMVVTRMRAIVLTDYKVDQRLRIIYHIVSTL